MLVRGARAAPLPRSRRASSRRTSPREPRRRSWPADCRRPSRRAGRGAARGGRRRRAARAPRHARCSNCCTPRAPASPRRSALNVDDVVDERGRCGCSARAASSGSCRSAATPARAIDAYLVRGRPGALRPRAAPPRRCSSALRGSGVSRQNAWHDHPGRRRARGARGTRVAAHPAALLRDAPARGRRRRARRAGAARPLLGRDHPDLHARHGGHPPGHVHDRPPARSLTRTHPPATAPAPSLSSWL